MNEKIKEIENVLMDLMNVSLAKQCKQEYIIYTFYCNNFDIHQMSHFSSILGYLSTIE